MRTLELQLADDLADRIEQAAENRGVSVAQLVEMSVEEKLAREAAFAGAAKAVLEKNAELYKRLA